MLSNEKHRAEFTGGLEAARFDLWAAARIGDVKPEQLFFAYDTPDDWEPLKNAVDLCWRYGFTRASHAVRAYVLCGYPNDSIAAASARMGQVLEIGVTPMAMLWRDQNGKKIALENIPAHMGETNVDPCGGEGQMSKWERRPPCSIEAERAILGAILLDEKSIFGVQGMITVEDFYVEFHRAIFESMLRLRTAQSPIDQITIKAEVEKQSGKLSPNWVTDLMQLTDGLPRSVNVEHYVEIVKEKSRLRHAITAANDAIEASFQAELPASEIIGDLELSLRNISNSNVRDFISGAEIVHRVYEQIEQRSRDRRYVTGVPSGFSSLDRMTTGWHEEELIIIAGRPGLGKTSLMLNMAKQAMIHEKKRVAIFSLEMSMEQLCNRFVADESGVPLHRIHTGFLERGDWELIAQASSRLAGARFWVCDSSQLEKLTVSSISNKAHRLREQYGIDLIIVDYLQLLSGTRAENRTQEITQITRDLKRMACVLQVPVISASQLNRAMEMGGGRKPQLSDLRESGSIEQDADVVIFIHRDMANEPQEAQIVPAELILGKQRNGPQGTVQVQFNKALTRFENPIEIVQEGSLEYGT